MITEDEFDQWRDNPVTQKVFEAFDILGTRARETWLDASWHNGNCDPILRADLHARAEVIADFREMTFEILEEWLDDGKHERNQPD